LSCEHWLAFLGIPSVLARSIGVADASLGAPAVHGIGWDADERGPARVERIRARPRSSASCFFKATFSAGLRVGEVVQLKVSDVDSRRAAEHIFANAKKRAGIIKRATFHSLRHSPSATLRAWFATPLLEDGADARYIQEFMGHDSL
jgi:site-specific recombinase XerD